VWELPGVIPDRAGDERIDAGTVPLGVNFMKFNKFCP
jgi:hypothetical protein